MYVLVIRSCAPCSRGGGALLKGNGPPHPQGCVQTAGGWGSEAPPQRMCTNCWAVSGPTPKDVYKLLVVQGPTPKDVYTLLGHSGGNLGVLWGARWPVP
eukprot:scaffold23883_cov39-Phaeocystis_antarctica.AAC.1